MDMSITFESLSIGGCYDRPFLANLWGYRGWAALARGIIAPANEKMIILFITKEKQKDLPQYQDTFDGEVLRIDGEDGHTHDKRLIDARSDGDQIHLFYRDRHHSRFTYEGRMAFGPNIRLSVTARPDERYLTLLHPLDAHFRRETAPFRPQQPLRISSQTHQSRASRTPPLPGVRIPDAQPSFVPRQAASR